ncbi:hypothetical protein LSCM1_03072 [Leishmania martiniquensis]|uniref:cyclin-dependent kinase n=1 Tax=Leishmania martiniquensis TaxID=1580590 RepID=A0A836KIP2_9TRYP|nr:hypothetical protein LSCM1_03072 [Leishmania martiniquensis]
MEKYDVLEVVGEGTYGIVFKCRDRRTNRIVAVKQFKNFHTNAYVRIAMLRELRVEQMLKGEPNVTQLLETFKQKNRLYLVMEYIPRSLLDVLERRPHGLPEDSLAVLLYTILLGIRSCHRNGIIHRDVKPENILVRDDGTASLCDFGFCRPLPRQLQPQTIQLSTHSRDTGALAKAIAGDSSFGRGSFPSPNHLPHMHDSASASSGNSAMLSELVFADHQTIMTNYVATRWYRSPEMLLGMPSYTYAVDMWAVGVIMAEAIDGEPLLPGKTELEQLSLIQTRIGDFPAAYEAAVRKRNGGILRLRSLNPLAVPPPPMRTKSMQQKSRQTSDPIGGAQESTETKQSTNRYLAHRYGGRIAKAGMNLLHRLLRIDAAERITVEEALEHPFFDEVRKRFHVSASGTHTAGNSDGACNAAAAMPVATKETTRSTAPQTATSPCSEPSSSPPATAAVYLVSDGAGSGGLCGPIPEVPPLMQVPFSLIDNRSAEAGESGSGPLPRPCGAVRSLRAGDVIWNGSDSPASPANSASLSLCTASGNSAGTVPPNDVMAKEGPVSFPQLPSVLAPLDMEWPNVNEAGGEVTAAAAGNGAAVVSHLPPPRPVSPADCSNGGQAVWRRQAVSEGANDLAVEHDSPAQSKSGSSNSFFRPWRSRHSQRDAGLFRHRPLSVENSAYATALTQADIPSMNAPAEETGASHDAVPAMAVNDMGTSAPFSSLRHGRAKKSSAPVIGCRAASRKSARATGSCAHSLSSLLAQLYPLKPTPMNRSKLLVQSLAPAAGQSVAQYHRSYSAREDGTRKPRCPGGKMSVPRIQVSRNAGERAAPESEGTDTPDSSSRTSNAPRSSCSTIGRSGGLPSVTESQGSGSGKCRIGKVMRSAPAISSGANETAVAVSSRSAAERVAEVQVQRRQSIPGSRPSPQPSRPTRTTTDGAHAANGSFHRPQVPTAPFLGGAPEALASLSASKRCAVTRADKVFSRRASLRLPPEVRPLPASERVTFSKENESLGFAMAKPSVVEVLSPVAAASTSPQPARGESNPCEEPHASRTRMAPSSAIAPAEQAAPASQPSESVSCEVRPDGERGEGDFDPSRWLAGTRAEWPESQGTCTSPARRCPFAPGTPSELGERTPGSEVEDCEPQQRLQQFPPHPGGSPTGRPARMDVRSLKRTASPDSTNAAACGSSRAAPSLIFRSFRAASSPLKRAAAHPSSRCSRGEGTALQLGVSERDAGLSESACGQFTTLSEPLASAGACRLAPALLRHQHLTAAAGACSPPRPTSRGPDVVLGSSAFSSHSPHVVKKSTWSPRLSPRSHRLVGFAGRRASVHPPIVPLLGARPQRRVSSPPMALSVSEELFADAAAGCPGGGGRGHGNAVPLRPAAAPITPDNLETVVLMETPPANRSTDQQRPRQVPSSGSWSPALSSTTAAMSDRMKASSTSSRGLGQAGGGSPAPVEEEGLSPTADVVHITASVTNRSAAPDLLPAVLTLDEDDAMNVSNTPPLSRRRSLDTRGAANRTPWPSQERPGHSLAPPQPLLGGASVPSAQQLHAGGGRRKSRLVL